MSGNSTARLLSVNSETVEPGLSTSTTGIHKKMDGPFKIQRCLGKLMATIR
jgi:hypothetical protein